MNQQKLITLVGKAQKNDNAAMEELYKAYYPDVLFVCRKYNLNEQDCLDISQETFIKAFQAIDSLENAAKFPAWLTRIATNKCINLLQHNKTLTMDTINDEELINEIPDKNKNSEDIVIDNEVSDILSEMIAHLPIEQRVTIFMYYYQDYSIKEIAKIYGCSENTVKSRLNYAKKAMRTEAEKLENKGIKLRVIAILPFLYMFFAKEREVFACEAPDCAGIISKAMAPGNRNSTNNSDNAARLASSTVKTGFMSTTASKVAVIATATLLIGGVAAGIIIPKSLKKPSNTDSTVSNPTTQNTEVSNNDNDTETTASNNETTASGETSKPNMPYFDVVDTDFYSDVRDSQYISFIMHNPDSPVLISKKTEGTKPAVLVYDMKQSMKDDFNTPFDTYVTINNFGYRFSVASDDFAIYDASSSAFWDSGYIHIANYEIKENKYGEEYLSWVANPDKKGSSLLNYFALYEKETDYDYTGKGSSVQFISDEYNSWYSSILLSDGEVTSASIVENLNIRVAKNDESNYYIYAPLKTPIPYDNNTEKTIADGLQTLTKGDIRILDSLDDFDSVSETYGDTLDVNISDTVFYQDIIASKISENLGLNLKNKLEFYQTDTVYIRYMHTGNTDGVQIDLAFENKDYTYEQFNDYGNRSRYEYTDSNGNKYSYFSSTSGIFIFKNEEFTHTKIKLEKIDADMYWCDALGQSFGIRK